MASDERMADGTTGPGPEQAPPGSRPFSSEIPNNPFTKEPIKNPFSSEKNKNYPPGTKFTKHGRPIFRVGGGEPEPDEDIPDGESSPPPSGGFNQRPGVDNDGPEKTRRPHASDEERYRAENLGQNSPEEEHAREERRRAAEDPLKLEQDWYNSFQEFSHYKTLMRDEQLLPMIQERIWDRVNSLLAVIDTDEAGDSPGIQEILQSVNILFAVPEFEEFRQDIINWIEARLTTHQVAFAAKYLKAEDWAKGTTNLRGRHFESLLTGSQSAGVKEASALLEDADENGAKGEWYRAPKAKNLDFLTDEVKDSISSMGAGDQLSRAWDLEKKYKLVDQILTNPDLNIEGTEEVFGFKNPQNRSFSEQRKAVKTANEQVEIDRQKKLFRQQLAESPENLPDHYKKLFLYVLNGMEEETRPTVNKSAYIVVHEMLAQQRADPESAVAKLLTGPDGTPIDTDALISMMGQVNRAFVIASKIHHSTAQSAIYDGLFWKEGAHVPDEYKGSKDELGYQNVGGGAVIVDAVLKWDIRDLTTKEKTGKVVEIHLATDTQDITGDDDPRKEQKEAYQNALKINSGYIAQAWSKAYRDFYVEAHDQIDWTNAIGGRGARTMKKLHYKIADEESVGEMSPGQFAHLRPYTGYTNTVSFFQFFGMNGNIDLLRGDKGWDKQFNRVKYNGARWAAMEKLQGTVEAKLLYDAHSLETPEAIYKTLGEIKNGAMILTKMIDGATDAQEQEVFEYMEKMAEGILNFRMHHSEEAELQDFNLNQADMTTRFLLAHDVISRHQYDHFRAKEFGPEWLTSIRVFRGYVSLRRGMLGFLGEFGSQIAKTLTSFTK